MSDALPTREEIAETIRNAWVLWAKTQEHPKPSWLVPWDELDEPSRSADIAIADALLARLRPAFDEIGRLKSRTWEDAKERDALRADLRACAEALAKAIMMLEDDWPSGHKELIGLRTILARIGIHTE